MAKWKPGKPGRPPKNAKNLGKPRSQVKSNQKIETTPSPKGDVFIYQRQPPQNEGSLTSVFAKTIKLETILDEVRRDETAYRALKRVSGDVFDKGFKVKAYYANGKPYLKLQQMVEEFNKRIQIIPNLKQSWELKQMLGFSLVGLGWKDSNRITQEPKSITDLDYIWPISRLSVPDGGLLIDYNRTSKNYGRLVAAKIKLQVATSPDITIQATSTSTEIVPASRFIHWPNLAPGSLDPYGMSIFEPVYDMLTVKKNLDWSFGEAAFQFAARKYVIIVPSNVSPEYWAYVQENWKDFDSLTTFAAKGEGHQIMSFGGEGQLDPQPYFDYYVSLLTSGIGIPKSILFHESLSGAEFVVKDYYTGITAIQETDVEPLIMELYGRLQRLKLLPDGIIDLEWNKLIELDERETSFVKSRFALGHSLQSKAVTEYLANGMGIEFAEDGWIKRVFVPQGDEKEDMFTLLPPPAPAEVATGNPPIGLHKNPPEISETPQGPQGVSKNARFTPPPSGNLPEAGKRLLARVYAACRTRWVDAHPDDPENHANKSSCAAIAWTAVKKAGFKVDEKELHVLNEEEIASEDDFVKQLLKEITEEPKKKEK